MHKNKEYIWPSAGERRRGERVRGLDCVVHDNRRPHILLANWVGSKRLRPTQRVEWERRRRRKNVRHVISSRRKGREKRRHTASTTQSPFNPTKCFPTKEKGQRKNKRGGNYCRKRIPTAGGSILSISHRDGCRGTSGNINECIQCRMWQGGQAGRQEQTAREWATRRMENRKPRHRAGRPNFIC